jgi:hypothetical protein
MRKFIHILASLIILGNLFIIGLIAFWLIYDYKVPDMKEPIEILNANNEIAAGDVISMKLEVIKSKSYKPNSTNFIKCNDGNLVTMNSTTKNIPSGSYVIESNTYILPPKVARGATCQFVFKNEYKVNPIRTITKEWVSEEFLIK